jgi:hypothetical protein
MLSGDLAYLNKDSLPDPQRGTGEVKRMLKVQVKF